MMTKVSELSSLSAVMLACHGEEFFRTQFFYNHSSLNSFGEFQMLCPCSGHSGLNGDEDFRTLFNYTATKSARMVGEISKLCPLTAFFLAL